MAFLDDLGKKITMTSQTVAKKAKDVAETGNLKLQMREEEKVLKGIYAEIGEKYFAVYEENPDPMMVELIEKVQESKKKMDILRENIAKIENEKICPSCGATMPEKGLFCPACGQKCPEPEAALEAEEIKYNTCAACGAQILEGALFCTKCGAKQGEVVPDTEADETVENPKEAVDDFFNQS